MFTEQQFLRLLAALDETYRGEVSALKCNEEGDVSRRLVPNLKKIRRFHWDLFQRLRLRRLSDGGFFVSHVWDVLNGQVE